MKLKKKDERQMKNRKNIDEIFQKGFENPDVSPSPQVWENIQARLEKEQSGKVIPLWIRVGSIAALVAIMLTVGNFVFDPFGTENPVVSNETIDKQEKHEQKQDIIPSVENEIVVTDTSSGDSDSLDDFSEGTVTSSKSKLAGENGMVTKPKSDSSTPSDSYGEEEKQIKGIQTQVASDQKSIPAEVPAERKNHSDIENNDNQAVAGTGAKEKENGKIASETDLRPSIQDAIAEQNNLKSSKKTDEIENRWRVTPNLAPVYYNGFGNGSSIDPAFSGNPQKGDVNMSYGVQVSYALNNKLRIRTGLNNVDLSYSTSDIIIATGPVSRGLAGVEYGNKEFVVTAVNPRAIPEGSPSGQFGELQLKNSAGNARLIQELNYYEVPLELQYSLIDKKIGVNLIGGVSTLFLGENEISVKSDNFSDILGPANNLSNVSFSTNLGVGFNYNFSKRFLFNIEPTFKYQLNPYSDSSVDFKPYYLGVYSGLSFKF